MAFQATAIRTHGLATNARDLVRHSARTAIQDCKQVFSNLPTGGFHGILPRPVLAKQESTTFMCQVRRLIGFPPRTTRVHHSLLVPSRAQSLWDGVRSFSKAYPLVMGFSFCFVKGCIADNINQRFVEKREVFSWKRNLGWSLFSGLYTGIFQGYLYVYGFDRIFGASSLGWSVIIKKACGDGFFHTPFIYMPASYFANNMLTGDTDPFDAVKTYFTWEEFSKSGFTSIAVWFPVQIGIFCLAPWLRVPVQASIGFFWQLLLCRISYLGDRAAPTPAIDVPDVAPVPKSIAAPVGEALPAELPVHRMDGPSQDVLGLRSEVQELQERLQRLEAVLAKMTPIAEE